jgi:hypothetical protein
LIDRACRSVKFFVTRSMTMDGLDGVGGVGEGGGVAGEGIG